MKLTLAEPKYLKDSISIISDLVSEGKFKITKECVEMVAMDPANVVMVIFKLLSSTFVEYNVEKDMDLSVNLTNLKQILSRAKPNDMLTLETSKDGGKLTVELKGASRRTFSLPIIESDEREQKVPQLKFPLSVRLNSASLNESIDDVDVVAESVTFGVDGKKFIVQAEGDLSEAMVEMEGSDDTKIENEVGEPIKAKYSVEYLKKIMKGSKLSPTALVQFNKDYPLRVEYKAVDRAMLAFILAPRVDND